MPLAVTRGATGQLGADDPYNSFDASTMAAAAAAAAAEAAAAASGRRGDNPARSRCLSPAASPPSASPAPGIRKRNVLVSCYAR